MERIIFFKDVEIGDIFKIYDHDENANDRDTYSLWKKIEDTIFNRRMCNIECVDKHTSIYNWVFTGMVDYFSDYHIVNVEE